MAVDARIHLLATVTQTSPLDLASAVAGHGVDKTVLLANGTGAGQADLVWSDNRTVNASATDSLDLAGVLSSAFGTTLTFARIKAVIVVASTSNTNNVLVTRPASNGAPLFSAAGDQIAVRPGGMFAWACTDATAVAVTAGTGDLLDIVNSGAGTTVNYDILVIGSSA